MRIKHWTQIAGGGRNGFIDNRPYIETVSALEKYVTLDDSERSVIAEAADRFPMRITPYYLSLIDPNDPNDPIRRMCIPSAAELDASGSYDTSGENDNTVRDGIQHKYKQTALVLSTNVCAAYCRHCFRKRMVGASETELNKQVSQTVEYVRCTIKKTVYVVTQFNHPREVTKDAALAVKTLREAGVHLRNQTVLLRGVNDDVAVLGTLLRKLTAIGVDPYYIFQCRPVKGIRKMFQVPLTEAVQIVDRAKNVQNGIGKSVRFVMSHPRGKIEILGKAADDALLFKFHQAKCTEDAARIFCVKVKPDTIWLDADLRGDAE